MSKAQRITLVISSLGGGGAERVAVDLCDFLARKGRDISVLTLSGNLPDAYRLSEAVLRKRMEIRREAKSLIQTIAFALEHLARMRQNILALKPDVVISFIDQTNVRTIGCLAGSRIPVLISERVHPGFHRLGRVWENLRKIAYRFASAVIVQTETTAEWFKISVPTRRLVVIPNAVRAPVFMEGMRGTVREPIILSVGRLTRQKGFDLLLRAIAESGLVKKGWRVVILGEGEERAALRQLASDCEIADFVEMPGYVSNVSDWMSRSGIFCLPSRYEGFPNALLEAMQTGLPCVSSDCPSGPRDLIDDGHNGLLVPVDDVSALAGALLKMAEDRSLRESLAREALAVGTSFSMDTIYGRWIDAIDSIYAKRL